MDGRRSFHGGMNDLQRQLALRASPFDEGKRLICLTSITHFDESRHSVLNHNQKVQGILKKLPVLLQFL